MLAAGSLLLALVLLAALCTTGCAPQKRRRGGTEYNKAQAKRATQELEASRSQKFAAMYRSSQEAEKRTQELESRLAEREAEVTQLRDDLARAQAASSAAEGASSEVAELRASLEQAETQLARLREESSSGPFEKEPKNALRKAHEEIDSLKGQLAREREEREAIARQFEDLKRRSPSSVADSGSATGEKETKLRLQLLHMMGTLERDLTQSREREQALRLELAQAKAVPASDNSLEVVSSLRAKNGELQASLEEAQRTNKQLQSKLAAASRVSELIFRMRDQEAQPAQR